MNLDDVNLAELWRELEADRTSVGDDEWIVRRINPDEKCDVRIGIDSARRTRTLLVRVVNSAIPASVEYPAARGFELREVALADCPRTHTTLGVFLTDRTFSEVYSTLVQDVLQRLAVAADDQKVVSELVDRLKLWQWFMERAGIDGLSQEGQRGLYGELVFLRDFLIPRLGPLAAVQAWTGPSGAAQDFQWRRRACEVKVTVAKRNHEIRISNELQLDTRAVDALWLYHLSLDARPGSGQTLVEAIDGVRAAIVSNTVAAERFDSLLLEAGYHPAHARRYDGIGYTIREASFFAVRDGFPRLVEADLRPGVGDVSYSISVAECMQYKVPASEVEREIGA